MKQGWEIKTIGSICDIKTGKLDANAASENGAYPFFTCSQTPLRIDNYAYDCECVLVAGNGELNAKYYKGKFNAYQRTYIITTKLEYKDISVKYLYKFFSKYIEQLRQLSIGGVIKYIKLGNLTDAKLPVPPREEQEKIVAELDCLSGIIEKKREQLKELDALAESIFYTMFGDPITNEKGWEVKKLGEVCDVCSSKRVFVDELVEEGIPFYRGTEIGQMAEGEKIIPSLYITSDHYEKLKKETGVPQIGDLLLPSICNDGRIWRVSTDAPYYFKDGRVLWIKCAGLLDGQFLRYQLKNIFINNYSKIASGTTFAELKIFILRDLKIYIPPINLQKEFADKIEAIEKQKELIKQSITQTEELFNSRMDYYFN